MCGVQCAVCCIRCAVYGIHRLSVLLYLNLFHFRVNIFLFLKILKFFQKILKFKIYYSEILFDEGAPSTARLPLSLIVFCIMLILIRLGAFLLLSQWSSFTKQINVDLDRKRFIFDKILIK